MNVVNFGGRSCERYRRYFDAYIDNELLVETSQDLLQHLNSCTDCAAILEDRNRLKRLVRNAVETEQTPPEFVAALRDRIRTERRSFFGLDTTRWIMALAAALLLAIGGLGTLQWGRIVRAPGGDGVFQTVSTRAQVNYVVTRPGRYGDLWAFGAEAFIAFLLMSVILRVSNTPGINRYTGLVAGLLVMTYTSIEAPISGMSMNPA